MLKHRIFPRYNTEKLRITIHMDEHSNLDFKVSNFSLEGLALILPRDIDVEPHITLNIKVSYQSYVLQGEVMWKHWSVEDKTGMIGLRLIFENIEFYDKHLRTIRALHELRMKRAPLLTAS